MKFGYVDSFTSAGILSGWLVGDFGPEAGIEFQIVIGKDIVALGKRVTERPDVEELHGQSTAGFVLKITPSKPIIAGATIRLVDLQTMEDIQSNSFVVPDDYIYGSENQQSAIDENIAVVEALDKTQLISKSFVSSNNLAAYPITSVTYFYLAMVELWGTDASDWVDYALVRAKMDEWSLATMAPLAYLFISKKKDLIPNVIFHPEYVRIQFGTELGVTADSPASEVLVKWLASAEAGVLFRPSPLVRSSKFVSGKFVAATKKELSQFFEKLNKLTAGNSGVSQLSELVPVFESAWVQSRPEKMKNSGRSVLRAPLLGYESTPPNSYFNQKWLEPYIVAAWKSDSGLPIGYADVKPMLADGLIADKKKFVDFKIDNLMYALREDQLVSTSEIDFAFIEKHYPGLVQYVSKTCRNQNKYEIYTYYLAQLKIPKKATAVDLAKAAKYGPVSFSSSQTEKTQATSKPPLTSVIVPTYGRLDLVHEFLRSLYASSLLDSFEVIIADDASPVDFKILQYFFPNIKIIKQATNQGFILNVNNSAKTAKGKYLLIANNDVIVHPNAVGELVYVLDTHADCDVVGGLVLSSNGKIQECGGAIWRDGSAWNLFRDTDTSDPGLPRNVRDVDYVSGCWMGVKRAAWELYGGFSEALVPAYCEDMDFCLKVMRDGRKVMINPHSVVTHLEGQSMGTDVNDKNNLKRYQNINRAKIVASWKSILSSVFEPDGNLSTQYRGSRTVKPIALIFDHYCPEPDKDAGSKTVFDLIKAIAETGSFYTIFVPENNHRSHYALELEKLGVEVICGSSGWARFDALLDSSGDKVELVLCSRLSVAKKYSWHIDKCSGHKAIYIHDVQEYRHATSYGVHDEIESTIFKHHANTWQAVYKHFDSVFVCTEFEKAGLGAVLDIPVHVIPPYALPPALPEREHQGKSSFDLIFIGSVNHGPNRTGIQWFLSAHWGKLVEALPNIKLHLVGSGFERYKQLEMKGVVLHGQLSSASLTHLYSLCNISIAPLLDGAGMKGKVVEALTNGIPCIGTEIAYQGLESCLADFPDSLKEICVGSPHDLGDRIAQYYSLSRKPSSLELHKALTSLFPDEGPGRSLLNVLGLG